MRHFQDEMDQLKASLVGMAGLAEEQVRKAMQALLERSVDKAQEVIDGDHAMTTWSWRSTTPPSTCWRCSSPWPGTSASSPWP
jgi:hypothetical protein